MKLYLLIIIEKNALVDAMPVLVLGSSCMQNLALEKSE